MVLLWKNEIIKIIIKGVKLVVKFNKEGVELIRNKINSEELKTTGRLKKTSFTRERKMGFTKLIKYILNKKELTTIMEINNFYSDINEEENIFNQSLLDQRLKLNPEVFIALNTDYLKLFYQNHKEEVKLYKGYLLKAIDGSDFEIPNTKEAKKVYGTVGTKVTDKANTIERAIISACYDVLNRYIIEGFISSYRTNENKSSLEHLKHDQEITKNYKSIYIMDRGYISIEFMLSCIKNNSKFLIRLDSKAYEKERSKIKDKYINLEYTNNRLKRRHYQSEEIRLYAKEIKSSKLRIVTHKLNTGEVEQLITNLEMDEFTYDDIVELYEKRWGIETLYYSLKWKLKTEKFTSSFKKIIEQDFFLVY